MENYYLGWLNSNVVYYLLKLFKEGSDFQNIEIKRLPLVDVDDETKVSVSEIAESNVVASKSDWDSYETSWDFKRNPLV